ncbi:hypothetical protein U3516DRAFT_739258 [Neocallimastix sp. 'constans']
MKDNNEIELENVFSSEFDKFLKEIFKNFNYIGKLWSSPYSNMVRRRRSQLSISKETPYRSTLRDPRGKAEPTIEELDTVSN